LRILIVTQYFWPEEFRVNDIAVGLRDASHEVTVLTGIPNYPYGSFFPGYGLFSNRKESFNGITVHRVPLLPRGKARGVRLALNYLTFFVSASVLSPARLKHQFDVIFVYGPSPITVAIPALLLKRRWKVPVVLWVQDLWPESVYAVADTAPKSLRSLLDRMVRWIYSRCDLILVQSRAFIPSVRKRTPERVPIRYFPNTAEEFYRPRVNGSDGAKETRLLPSGFRVMFAGNIGAAQDFPTILDAASRLRDYNDIQWIILGDGHLRAWVAAEIGRRNLGKCVHLPGRFAVESMPRFFASADVLLATLRHDPVFALTVPSKVQSYLACGRPVLAALEGEGARIVEEAAAGLSCPPQSPDALAAAVLELYRMSHDERESLGRNGRSYFEQQFARPLLLKRLDGWMSDVVNGRLPREF
jgi:colanic acid biosynthesis glycosyl transferase WcaI